MGWCRPANQRVGRQSLTDVFCRTLNSVRWSTSSSFPWTSRYQVVYLEVTIQFRTHSHRALNSTLRYPIYLPFSTAYFNRFETRVKAFQDQGFAKEGIKKPTDSWLSFWFHIGRMVGYSTNSTLEQELASREESFGDAQRLFNQMRVSFTSYADNNFHSLNCLLWFQETTESSPHYSDINKALPQDGLRLAMLDGMDFSLTFSFMASWRISPDGSATELLRVIGGMTPSVERKAKYMRISFANSIGLLSKGTFHASITA